MRSRPTHPTGITFSRKGSGSSRWSISWPRRRTILAEVLIGLLAFDPLSFLNVEPGWKPDFAGDKNVSEMPQLIDFALNV